MNNELYNWCKAHCIDFSKYGNSFYFHIGKNKYRVSNHPMSTSKYHSILDEEDTIDIISNDIKGIYNSLLQGTILAVIELKVNGTMCQIAVDLKETTAKSFSALNKVEGFKIIQYKKINGGR